MVKNLLTTITRSLLHCSLPTEADASTDVTRTVLKIDCYHLVWEDIAKGRCVKRLPLARVLPPVARERLVFGIKRDMGTMLWCVWKDVYAV